MYAIIRTGGKQYRVAPGDVIRVEKLDQALGSEFDLTDVVFISENTQAGPSLKNAKVTVVVTRQTKDKKVIIFKKKRRQGYRRFKTHRQPFTELFVKAISHGGQTAKADDKPNVVDFDAQRKEKIAQRTEAKNEAKQNKEVRAEKKASKSKPVKKAAPKKTAKKAVKKGAAGKKTAKKKTAKKAAKKK